MHSWTSRASAVFSYACFALLFATIFNAGTHFLLKGEPSIQLHHAALYKMGNVQLHTLHDTGELLPDEHGVFVHFNLTADLRPLWTWSTHEIFVMVVAEFETPVRAKNHVVIWDKIITSKSAANLQLAKESPEYAITDHTADLSNLPVTLVVKYDVIPIAGPLLLTRNAASQKFTLPSKVTLLPLESAPRRFYAPNTRPY